MTAPETISAQDARRELAIRIATSLDVSARHEVGRAKFWLSDVEMGIVLDALRAEPARGAEEMRKKAIACAEAEAEEADLTAKIYKRHQNGPARAESLSAAMSCRNIAAAIRALPLTQDTQGESDG